MTPLVVRELERLFPYLFVKLQRMRIISTFCFLSQLKGLSDLVPLFEMIGEPGEVVLVPATCVPIETFDRAFCRVSKRAARFLGIGGYD